MSQTSDIQITASLSERITADFRLKISSGAWAPGAALQTRRELAKSYGVALRTIEQAMAPLISEGVVEAKGVKGTFVALEGDRRIDASRIDTLSIGKAMQDSTTPISLGIIGMWSGIHGENMVESIGSRAIEHDAAAHANVSLHYFNRYVGRNVPGLPMEVAAKSLIDEGVDGIITFTLQQPDDSTACIPPFVDVVEVANVPVVMFGRTPSHIHLRQVSYDDVYAGYEAARHLISRDWRSIVYMAPFDAFWIADRREGVRQAVQASVGLGVELRDYRDPSHSVEFSGYGHYQEQGYIDGKALLLSMTEPVAIIACNDMVAYGVLDAAAELGFQTGKDFAIIGFDDYVHSRRYALSSVRPPLEQMGGECVDMIMRAVRGERCPLVVTLQSEVVSRSSTTRPRSGRDSVFSGVREKELTR
ncbi:MAG TPA: GntR family transcriptional regulator [Capsulimonadaceae bacterium]|jgi:LacI family transcriptional regulator